MRGPYDGRRRRARPAAIVALALLIAGCVRDQVSIPGREVVALPPPFAQVVRLETAPPPGEMVDGQAGDWALRNEHLTVVVSDIGRRGGFAANGGVIVDVVPSGGSDLLREIFPCFDNTFPRQAVYESVRAEPESAAAVLVVEGKDSDDPSLHVTTRYTLRAGAEALQIVTTVTNTGSALVREFELGDAIQWGRAIPFAPGPGRDLPGSAEPLPFLVAAGEGTAYGWLSPGASLTGPHGGAWSDPIATTADLDPGASVSYERLLFASRGSEAEATRWAWQVRGERTEHVEARVLDEAGRPVAQATVEARDERGKPRGLGRADAEGNVVLTLVPGTYAVSAAHPEHGRSDPHQVRLRAGHAESETFEVPAGATLVLVAADDARKASPAKWTFQGEDGTPDPDFGQDHARGAGRVVFSGSGTAQATLPAGRYRITASRGPLYEIWQTETTVVAGKSGKLEATLTRLPVPAAWVTLDPHVHALPSVDSIVSLSDRLESAAAEGIDWFVSADHGMRTDYGPALGALSLAAPVNVITGEEISTTRFGHFTAYPMPLRPGEPGNGALDSPRLGLDAIFEAVRSATTHPLLQVNHPRTGHDGYFDRMGFNPEAPEAAGVRLDVDALEVFSSRHFDRPDAVWGDWMALLNSGHKITAMGASDSHRLVADEIGYPRNVLLPRDANVRWTQEEVVRAVREGRVVVTDGPMIELTVQGKGPGSTVTTSPGMLSAHVKVWAASWVDVSRVELIADGKVEAVFPVPADTHALRFDEDVTIPLRASGFVLVRVEGERGLEPVVFTRSHGAKRFSVKPLAFTNPMWVEIPKGAR